MATNPEVQKQMYSLGASMVDQGQRGYGNVTRAQQLPGAQQGLMPPPPALPPAMDSRGNIIPNMFMVNGKAVTAAQANQMTPGCDGMPRGTLLAAPPPKPNTPMNSMAVRDAYIQKAQEQGGGIDLARELAKLDGWALPKIKDAAKFIQKMTTPQYPPPLAPPVPQQQTEVAANTLQGGVDIYRRPDALQGRVSGNANNGSPYRYEPDEGYYRDGKIGNDWTSVPTPGYARGNFANGPQVGNIYALNSPNQLRQTSTYPALDVPMGQPYDPNMGGSSIYDDWQEKAKERSKKRKQSEDGSMGMLAPLYMDPTTGAKGRAVYADLMRGLGQ